MFEFSFGDAQLVHVHEPLYRLADAENRWIRVLPRILTPERESLFTQRPYFGVYSSVGVLANRNQRALVVVDSTKPSQPLYNGAPGFVTGQSK